ncbi:N-acetylmuramoyl-L-alanine amidase [Neobacillus niacini]|uniref:N-acetylmuramoyl-L-alanine amidase family protein n=1 Tax=Neobacillus niacini TaxID=86668 RepID=UPI003002F535
MDFMIDAGHDILTIKGVPGMKEFEFNRAVVLKIQEFLKEYENVNAILSHDLFDKVDTPLKDRTDLAKKLKVKAFISIHADAFSNSTAKGESVFVYLKPRQSSVSLANVINDELKADMSVSNRGIKYADFHVLRETNNYMDGVLIEFGFMTNPSDLALLKSDAYRLKCAEMIVKALTKFYGLKKKEVAPVLDKTPFKVVVPNTAFWQTKSLIPTYMDRGYKCYGDPSLNYDTKYPVDNDPWPFVIETTLPFANHLVNEFKKLGYDRVFIEELN